MCNVPAIPGGGPAPNPKKPLEPPQLGQGPMGVKLDNLTGVGQRQLPLQGNQAGVGFRVGVGPTKDITQQAQ